MHTHKADSGCLQLHSRALSEALCLTCLPLCQVAQYCSALPYLRTDHGVPSEPDCWLTRAINTIRTVYPRSEALDELPLMVQILLLQAQQHLRPLFEPQADTEAFEALISDAARQRFDAIQGTTGTQHEQTVSSIL